MNETAILPNGLLIVSWLTVLRLIFYVYGVFRYHYAHYSSIPGQIPPVYPSFFPYIGSLFPLLWDMRRALSRMGSYKGKATVTQLSILPGFSPFLYQDPLVVREIWEQSGLLQLRPMGTYLYQTVFGDSGSPAADDGLQPHVARVMHDIDQKELSGSGLSSIIQRFTQTFSKILVQTVSDDWKEMDDLWVFYQDTLGQAIIEAILGTNLLKLHPDFISDFYDLDRLAPSLIMRTPFARAERSRDELAYKFQDWMRASVLDHVKSSAHDDGQDGSYWGSDWTRRRHQDLRVFFDDASTLSQDVSVTWRAMTNIVPTTMMATIHVVQDKALLNLVQRAVDDVCCNKPITAADCKSLSDDNLLSAIWAETLRLYVTGFIPVLPTYGDLHIGKWRIPQFSIGLVNSGISHRNKEVWNTYGGAHPVESFWAQRFIVDPSDPLSGPVKPESRTKYGVKAFDAKKPYFSLEGLDGSWIPFGGGQNMCPGRFLAKDIMTYAVALLTRDYEMEIGTDSIHLDRGRFGISVGIPKHPIPFRIRKRMKQM